MFAARIILIQQQSKIMQLQRLIVQEYHICPSRIDGEYYPSSGPATDHLSLELRGSDDHKTYTLE